MSKEGLAVSASTKGAQAGKTLVVTAHATDGDGVIYLRSVDWGDGPVTLNQRGKTCPDPVKAPADCRDYTLTHTYSTPGPKVITLTFVSGSEVQTVDLNVTIAPPASPAPTHGP